MYRERQTPPEHNEKGGKWGGNTDKTKDNEKEMIQEDKNESAKLQTLFLIKICDCTMQCRVFPHANAD